MNYEIGDIVWCPPSGPHVGKRLGKVIISEKKGKTQLMPVLVGYIDFPEDFPGGYLTGFGAWVHPIKKIKIS